MQSFYSHSAQIGRERSDYYDLLALTQKGEIGVVQLLSWFMGCLLRAIQGAKAELDATPWLS